MSELSFWDIVTLGVALGIAIIFIVVRVKRTLGSTGGCSSCASSCTPDEKQQGCSTTFISVDQIAGKKDGKQ